MSDLERPTPGKKRNSLTRPDAFRVARWIDQNWDKLKNMTRSDALVGISNELDGLYVTSGQLNSIIKGIGREWPGRNARRSRGKKAILARNLAAVIEEVQDVYTSLGVPFNSKGNIDIQAVRDLCRNAAVKETT